MLETESSYLELQINDFILYFFWIKLKTIFW